MLTLEQNAAFFADALTTTRAMAILRGFAPDRTRELADAAWASGIELVEIPLQSAAAAHSIRSLASGGDRVIGAGTITTPELAAGAARHGARFTVSPGYDPRVAERSLELDMAHLPGVATPSEVQRAIGDGFVWLKAFPASVLGPDWIRAMYGPFPEARFIATGGIDTGNFEGFLDAGVAAVAFGTSIESLDAAALERLR